jgi:hypothetical protein
MTVLLSVLAGIIIGYQIAKWSAIWGMTKAMNEGRLFIFNDKGQWIPNNPRIDHKQ